MTKKTVFVIGAGASKEIGLPVGEELKTIIANLIDIRFDQWGERLDSGDFNIYETLRILSRGTGINLGTYLREAKHISGALPQAISIDNFIDAHKGNEQIAICGKLGIVKAILESERQSKLYFDKSTPDKTIDFSRLTGTWYTPFFQQLTENCRVDDLVERFSNITLIVFNYDRCIEHFIFNALKNYYKITDSHSAELVKSISIYHPYGVVGLLPWSDHVEPVGFGMSPSPQQLIEAIKKIKTFTEGIEPNSSEINQIKESVSCAERLIFAGFAFHKLNMQLIAPNDKGVHPHMECFATVHNISVSDQRFIKSQLRELYGQEFSIEMDPSTCNNFFNNYWRSLSF